LNRLQKSESAADLLRPKPNHEILETLLLRVCAVHRLQPDWTFEEYMVMAVYIQSLFSAIFRRSN
jgi:hypothetical protein